MRVWTFIQLQCFWDSYTTIRWAGYYSLHHSVIRPSSVRGVSGGKEKATDEVEGPGKLPVLYYGK